MIFKVTKYGDVKLMEKIEKVRATYAEFTAIKLILGKIDNMLST